MSRLADFIEQRYEFTHQQSRVNFISMIEFLIITGFHFSVKSKQIQLSHFVSIDSIYYAIRHGSNFDRDVLEYILILPAKYI